jgi:hypothetical protein
VNVFPEFDTPYVNISPLLTKIFFNNYYFKRHFKSEDHTLLVVNILTNAFLQKYSQI